MIKTLKNLPKSEGQELSSGCSADLPSPMLPFLMYNCLMVSMCQNRWSTHFLMYFPTTLPSTTTLLTTLLTTLHGADDFTSNYDFADDFTDNFTGDFTPETTLLMNFPLQSRL